MHHTTAPLSERHPVASLWSAPPPWAERAIGAAAVAVFLAGIVSAGLVDSEGGPAAPTLAAPATATVPTTGGAHPVQSVDDARLSFAYSPSGVQHTGTTGGTRTAAGTNSDLARGNGSVSPPPTSGPGSIPPSAPPTTANPPAATNPDPPPATPTLPAAPTLPVPDNGVTAGPVTVDMTPDDGATVTITPGVGDPVTIHFP